MYLQSRKWLAIALPLVLTTLMFQGDARRVNRRFIIHVALPIRTHHHTHTIYSHIHTGATKQTLYKILGYSTDSHGHRDMIFNHYSRHDEDYPEFKEEYIDDERGEIWA